MQAIDPATGAKLDTYPDHAAEEVERRLAAAHTAWQQWKTTDLEVRASALRRAAQRLRARKAELAAMMTAEMGKPAVQASAEVEKCAWVCEYYADHGAAMLSPEDAPAGGLRSQVVYRPLGPILAIMPWNFPFWQLFRMAAPALMAGNSVVLKHAPNVPGCAMAIESVLAEIGLPDGLCPTLLVDVSAVEPLVADRRIAGVTLTGSTRAGRAVAALAGAHLKKCVLELGGSDAYVVLDDADPVSAAEVCVRGRMLNGGQSCIAAKRLIVTPRHREAFEREIKERMADYAMTIPTREESQLGPMAREDLRDALHRQVMQSVEQGASLLLGGEVPDRAGWWYPATVLTDVTPGMAAFDEELFGPVAAIVLARDEAHALELANQSDYGLGACVFSSDLERAERIAADQLDAGCCFVNAFVRSDPRLPFGGIKESGFGRELGRHGILEFVNAKTVYVAEHPA